MKSIDKKNYHLGCVLRRSDGALVCSKNERTKVPQPYAHAEVRAIMKADKGSILYIARVTKDNSWAMAKPCLKCQVSIRSRKIKKVYYTIGPGEFGVWYPINKL